MKYIVKDWTGKTIEFYGESESFEKAWEKVYENFSHLNKNDFDQQMTDFHVEENR